ncbi:MAG: pantetheine-phosphate adenylyltransferase [Acidimicrobiales bacterium]
MTRAMYPGSFDPVHLGHVDIVETLAQVFDEVVVVAMFNPEKPTGFFDLDEREAMLSAALSHLVNVKTSNAPGLVVHAARDLGVDVIVKGVRGVSDLDIEVQMANTNKAVSEIPTMLMPAEPATSFISSRFVREIAARGEQVDALVPAVVADFFARKAST